MTARRDGGWTQPPFANGPVHRLLADPQEASGFFRADEVGGPRPYLGLAPERLDVLGQEAAVTSRGDGGGLEQPARYSAKNGRPADAKAGC
jgi:hypothetical protein